MPESTSIIEYVQRRFPGETKLIPDDADLAERVRAADRFYDLHVHEHMQRIVGDRLRPADGRDPLGVGEARARLRTALGVVESEMATRRWAVGDVFTMGDCAAAPALYFADRVMPLADEFPNAHAYLGRLMQRPSYAHVLAEAEPYFKMFPT